MTMDKLFSDSSTLIVGCGYLGNRVAIALKTRFCDSRVFATTRSPGRASELAKAAIEPILADWTDRRTLTQLPRCSRVLVAVSYDSRSGKTREESQVGGLRNLLDFLPHDTDICYISTTGVYHQTDGSWVDESSPARPRAEGGLAHLRAESLLHSHRPSGKWTILRLAGIYGPGRVPRAADVIAGRVIEGPHAGYLNLIHVEDAADAVIAGWALESIGAPKQQVRAVQGQSRRQRLYAVADDLPVIRRAFYEQIAKQAGVAPPRFSTESTAVGSSSPKPSSRSAAFLSSRSGSNKRIWNRRFRRDLMPRLRYRNYIDGLSALELRG
jgi:nucleoside-diphosphate-sugar epimerase